LKSCHVVSAVHVGHGGGATCRWSSWAGDGDGYGGGDSHAIQDIYFEFQASWILSTVFIRVCTGLQRLESDGRLAVREVTIFIAV
jgi:hypothetical protein